MGTAGAKALIDIVAVTVNDAAGLKLLLLLLLLVVVGIAGLPLLLLLLLLFARRARTGGVLTATKSFWRAIAAAAPAAAAGKGAEGSKN